MDKTFLTILIASACVLATAVQAETRYVTPSGNDSAAGTARAPWRTLQHGVDALQPGDTLVLGPGLYRESVTMKHGGTAREPLTIAAQPGAQVVVTGADSVNGGWSRSAGAEDDIYSRDWAYRFPIGGPNDLTHPGDKEHQLTGRAEQVIHAGRLLRQVLTRQQLAPGTFFVDLDAKKLFVWLRASDNPENTD